MDTKAIETAAEDAISSDLQQAGMLVAKPKFDRKGTDLLVFADMKDGVKFCRIQCKGRSVLFRRAHINIPFDYVTDGFVVILCVLANQAKRLYCFLPSDIRRWQKTPKNQYTLYLRKATYQGDLLAYSLDASKIRLIETIIRSAETSGEFRSLVYGPGQVTLESVRAVGFGTCVGGIVPNPSVDGFPLLVYAPAHYGDDVYTEDGQVSVRAVAAAFIETLNPVVVAQKFGTTLDHVTEAVKYARKAGFLNIMGSPGPSPRASRRKKPH